MRADGDVSPRRGASGHRTRALLAVVGAAALLGTAGTIAALGPDDLRPSTMAAWRTMIGGGGLLGLAALGRARRPARIPSPADGGTPWGWTSLGVAAVVVNQLAFFEAIDRTGVATGTLVTVAAVPVAAGVIDRLDRHPPGPRWLAGVALAVVGVSMLTGVGRQAEPLGVLAAVVAGTAAALWGRSAQQLMRARPPSEALALIVGGAGAVAAPLALARTGEVLDTPGAAATVLLLGLVTATAAFRLWGAGLAVLPLAVVGAATLVEPVVATVLAIVLVDEPARAASVAGAALVVAGVAVATVRQ